MAKYINKRTQAVIDTVCELNGGDWEKVEDLCTEKESEATVRRAVKKKRGE